MEITSPWEFFSLNELKCKCGHCESTGKEMDAKFMDKLCALRRVLLHPLILNSAYRCPTYNLTVAKSELHGPHTQGKAVDIRCDGQLAFRIIHFAINLGFTGIGVAQKGSSGSRYVHVDTVSPLEFIRPDVWSY